MRQIRNGEERCLDLLLDFLQPPLLLLHFVRQRLELRAQPRLLLAAQRAHLFARPLLLRTARLGRLDERLPLAGELLDGLQRRGGRGAARRQAALRFVEIRHHPA